MVLVRATGRRGDLDRLIREEPPREGSEQVSNRALVHGKGYSIPLKRFILCKKGCRRTGDPIG